MSKAKTPVAEPEPIKSVVNDELVAVDPSTIEVIPEPIRLEWTDVPVRGCDTDVRTIRQVAEGSFVPGSAWETKVGVTHRHLMRKAVDGSTVLRPDSYTGDDEIA